MFQATVASISSRLQCVSRYFSPGFEQKHLNYLGFFQILCLCLKIILLWLFYYYFVLNLIILLLRPDRIFITCTTEPEVSCARKMRASRQRDLTLSPHSHLRIVIQVGPQQSLSFLTSLLRSKTKKMETIKLKKKRNLNIIKQKKSKKNIYIY